MNYFSSPSALRRANLGSSMGMIKHSPSSTVLSSSDELQIWLRELEASEELRPYAGAVLGDWTERARNHHGQGAARGAALSDTDGTAARLARAVRGAGALRPLAAAPASASSSAHPSEASSVAASECPSPQNTTALPDLLDAAWLFGAGLRTQSSGPNPLPGGEGKDAGSRRRSAEAPTSASGRKAAAAKLESSQRQSDAYKTYRAMRSMFF